MRRWFVLVLAVCSLFVMSCAQVADAGTLVEIEAADGAALKGEMFFPETLEGESAPVVFLMHQNGGRRTDWLPLVTALNEAGYAALTVDLRGFGDTGGTQDWVKAQQDTQDWLFYLQNAQDIDAARIGVIGASIGSNLALVGCAANEACRTAVAISPGLDYFGVQPESALVDGGLHEKSALLIVSQRDAQSSGGVKQMAASATGEVGIRIYTGSSHGTALFATKSASLSAVIVGWLDEMLAPAE